jgi:hypothetical protein
MTESVRWCCVTFKGWYEEPDARGLRIVGVSQSEKAFYIVGRAVDPEFAGEIAKHNLNFPVSTVMQLCIRFCPWCGKNLDRHYRAQRALTWRSEPPVVV